MPNDFSVTINSKDSIVISKGPLPAPKIAHVYSAVDKLEGSEKVGTKQCVALLQHYIAAPNTKQWERGDDVLENITILKGTAIATFVDKIYESNKTGNHAAFYVSQDSNGITIMDQWSNDTKKPKVSSRYLRKKGKNENGGYIEPSNNAEAYSIILW